MVHIKKISKIKWSTSTPAKKLKNTKPGARGSLKHQRRSISARRSLTWTRPVCPAALAAQAYALKEENDSLRWQLDAYRNEVELLKQEKEQLSRTEESLTKDRQVQFLRQTMRGMQQVTAPLLGGPGPRALGAAGRGAGGEEGAAEKLSGGISKVPTKLRGRRGSGEKPHRAVACGVNNDTPEVGNKGRESKGSRTPHVRCGPLANG